MALPEEMITGEEGISDYIPQKPPMVMIGKLLRVEGPVTVTSFRVREDNLLFDGSRFTEAGLIENIAQTAAAGEGHRSRQKGELPRPGFIGGIKNLVIHSFPVVGDVLVTEVSVEHEILDATVIRGKVSVKDVPAAECEMKIFLGKSSL
jgi:predicted hotdog family 3-hydroxylacyl-ACP dehydratase